MDPAGPAAEAESAMASKMGYGRTSGARGTLRCRRPPFRIAALVPKWRLAIVLTIIGWENLFGVLGVPLAQTPSDVVSQAFKNRRQASAESAQYDISFSGNKRQLSYVRQGNDKLAIKVTTAKGGTSEITIFGQSVFSRTDGGSWSRSQRPASLPVNVAGPPPTLSNLAESEPVVIDGRKQRVFTGDGRWQFGATNGIGTWKITIDAAKVLPTQVEFSGQCSNQPCGFVQKSSFGPALSVDVPAIDADSVGYVIYRLGPNGSAGFFLHSAVPGHAGTLKSVGTGNTDLAGAAASTESLGEPVVYGKSAEGFLSWRSIKPGTDGKFAESPSVTVDDGWSPFREIAAGDNGAIYGRYPVDSDATHAFRWRRHLGYRLGLDKWGSLTSDIGDKKEWGQYLKVFCGSKGVFYGILPNGDLMWHRHEGYLDGQDKWSAEIVRVGPGWNEMKAVAPAGDGVIYAVNKAGQLVWTRHRGYLTGEDLWDGPVVIANDWKDTVSLFAFKNR
jgi:hypothetical protein